MSRRSFTTVTFSITINLPAGESLAAFITRFGEAVTKALGTCVIRLTDKKVTYL